MKKLLALVLALVMTLSLAVVGSNAAFKDADKVSATYAEAVDVLAGMKVFQGYPDGSFQPEGSITRAEVAAIVYRLYTGDVADKQASLYATYNKFNDMGGAKWAAGYIGYCANAGLVKGYDAKTFGPSDKVTGYQALAMILRAVGYDKAGEFTGADWQLHVAQYAQQLGILKNVKGEDLNAAASRQLVAELLFQTAAKVPCVTYTAALGYSNTSSILGTTKNDTLGYKNFGLTKTADTTDKWGRPCYKWTNGKTGSALVTYATVKATPVATYTKAVAECDVAHDAGLTADTAYTLYVNGEKVAAKYTVNLTDTTTKIGAQGRLVEVYDDSIVMIDTFLAKVTYVAAATYDAQNHLKTPATITLEAYEAGTINPTTQLKSAKATAYTLTNGKTNYEYAVGDYVLLNAFTAVAGNTATESGAITTTTTTKPGDIVGKATSIDGAQTIIYWNSKQHNVEGTVYDDAAKFWLDEAGKESTKHTWFFDSYGNLIGAVDIAAATSYGVINSIWWAGNAADGSGVAKANVTYMDGTTGQVDISEITYFTGNAGQAYTSNRATGTVTHSTNYTTSATLMQAVGGYFYVDSYATENARVDAAANGNGILNNHLFQFTTKANGTLKAIEVAGNGLAQPEVVATASAPYQSAIPAGLYNTTAAVSKNTQVYGSTAWQLVVNDNTTFLVRTKTGTSYTFSSVKGFTNVGSYTSAEVDFVDVNGDRVADYVYVTAPSATSKVTSLFYFDGQQGAYTLADGTWVVKGYVDGEAGEVKFANYAALNSTLTKQVNGIATATAPETNTLYVVSLEDGVVVAGHKAVNGEAVAANDANHPLAAVYATYTNTLKIAYVEGAAGTAANGYADRDTYSGSIYYDADAQMYYSVINGTSKIVGTMGAPANQNYYFVYVNATSANLDRFCPQAYAFDKSAVATNGVVTATIVSVKTGAKVGNLVNSVEFTALGTGTNISTPVALDVAAKWQRYWVNPTTGAATWVDCIDGEVFQSTTQYRALMTLSVPSAQSANITIAPTNVITYPYPGGSTTGTGVQIYTDAFTPTV